MNKLNKDKRAKVNSTGSWVGVGTALGAAVFAITKEPVWIGVGVALGGAIDWTSRKKHND